MIRSRPALTRSSRGDAVHAQATESAPGVSTVPRREHFNPCPAGCRTNRTARHHPDRHRGHPEQVSPGRRGICRPPEQALGVSPRGRRDTFVETHEDPWATARTRTVVGVDGRCGDVNPPPPHRHPFTQDLSAAAGRWELRRRHSPREGGVDARGVPRARRDSGSGHAPPTGGFMPETIAPTTRPPRAVPRQRDSSGFPSVRQLREQDWRTLIGTYRLLSRLVEDELERLFPARSGRAAQAAPEEPDVPHDAVRRLDARDVPPARRARLGDARGHRLRPTRRPGRRGAGAARRAHPQRGLEGRRSAVAEEPWLFPGEDGPPPTGEQLNDAWHVVRDTVGWRKPIPTATCGTTPSCGGRPISSGPTPRSPPTGTR
jgi:hypothetical protein